MTEVIDWNKVQFVISLLANVATVVTGGGVLLLFRQVLIENRAREKDSNASIWDLLGSEEVYRAKMYIECNDPPEDMEAALTGDSEWIGAALKCYLAYTKVGVLINRHNWMNARDFAIGWGYATLVVWRRLQPFIDWYRRTRSYPSFGNSLGKLVDLVYQFDDEVLGFQRDMAGETLRPSQVLLSNTLLSTISDSEK